MKKLLLVTPESAEIHRYRKRQFNNFVQLTMPYLAGFVDESKYRIRLVDEYNQCIPYHERFDLVAITVNTANAVHAYAIAARFQAVGAAVVMGGPHATLLPDEAAAHCDYLIVGEAEQTWPQFLTDFDRGNAQPRYDCRETPSLCGLPLPRRDLLHRRGQMRNAVISSRGCPYHCRYCNLKQIYQPGFRTRPVNEVIAEIRSLHGRYVVFWDDNFFGDPQYTKELLRQLIPLRKRWAAQVTINHCEDDELLQLAKDSGCLYLFLGLESFSNVGLMSVGKSFNNAPKYREVIRRIHRYRISVQAGIIFGFDTDTSDVFDTTLQACEQCGIDGATVSILTPFPETPIYIQLKQEGRLLPMDWSGYNGKTRVAFQPKQMCPDELYEGYMSFRRRFYSIRSIIKRLLVSRVNILHSLLVNLGYLFSLVGLRSVSRGRFF